MSVLAKRLIASFALLAFALTLMTGLVFQVSANTVILRSLVAFTAFGAATGFVAFIFERLWNR